MDRIGVGRACALGLAALAAGCVASEERKVREDAALPPPLSAAVFESIRAEDLMRRIEVLSADAFEGRAPGTPGEDLTIDYLVGELQAMGLQTGNPDGTWVQEVPMVGFRAKPEVSIQAGGAALELAPKEDFIVASRRLVPEVDVGPTDVVFVGYGVVAPEYEWDDYGDVDVAGKTILMLVNDPQVPDPADPEQLDPALFKGRAMTYYGRWTYKYEIATEKGAAAALIVHETDTAGYGWGVVAQSFGRENFDLETSDGNASRVPVEGWISREAAVRLCAAAGQDFEALKAAAAKRGFRPVPLAASATFKVENELRRVRSRNVVARLEGSDPERRDELVVYTAHWDHLGNDLGLQGDTIYNGAIDNATGTAGLLELAEAFSHLRMPPPRSILFLFVTAEEKGLLGSKYYAANPLYPLESTLADINLDVMNPWGPTRDVSIIGMGQSTLEDLLIAAAVQQGRSVEPESEPEKGSYYRSDHFEFAKRGVPALRFDGGTDFIGKPEGFGREKRREYTENRYHKVTDEIEPDWDLSGAVTDLWLLFRVGLNVAYGDSWPAWKPGSEFKAVRDRMLAP